MRGFGLINMVDESALFAPSKIILSRYHSLVEKGHSQFSDILRRELCRFGRHLVLASSSFSVEREFKKHLTLLGSDAYIYNGITSEIVFRLISKERNRLSIEVFDIVIFRFILSETIGKLCHDLIPAENPTVTIAAPLDLDRVRNAKKLLEAVSNFGSLMSPSLLIEPVFSANDLKNKYKIICPSLGCELTVVIKERGCIVVESIKEFVDRRKHHAHHMLSNIRPEANRLH